jgi:hypothetical protein
MDDVYVPLQPIKLDEASMALVREFFAGPNGQKVLQYLRSARPSIIAAEPTERHMQLERRLGYEELYENLITFVKSKP